MRSILIRSQLIGAFVSVLGLAMMYDYITTGNAVAEQRLSYYKRKNCRKNNKTSF